IRRLRKKVSFAIVTDIREELGEVVEDIVATREYFPSTFRRAVKQKARWITGIVLQSWGRIRFRGPLSFVYCLFRDRKSLVAAPVGVLANFLLLYCVARLAGDALGWWTFDLAAIVAPGTFTWWLVLFDLFFT